MNQALSAKDLALRHLNETFGFNCYREGQAEVIEAIVEGRDVVAIMPTGAGKSLCYQLPALIRPGLTLVISPLIALMKDQLDQLTRLKIPATFINSSLTRDEQEQRLDALTNNAYKLVYIAPERFSSSRFNQALSGAKVGLLAIDEAHCISQWGHDFRPDYLKLGQAIRRLGRPPIAAFTATATPAVREDIIRQLELCDPEVYVTGLDRKNLILKVVGCAKQDTKLERIEALLPDQGGSAIIYCATRNKVEKVVDSLTSAGSVTARPYHAGMEQPDRQEVQESFMAGRFPVVVATNAFGMGVDKPDIRGIIHFNFPGTLEAYYQEIGRAGRDGEQAICTLLFNTGDNFVQEFFINSNHPRRETIQEVYRYLDRTGVETVEAGAKQIAEQLGRDTSEHEVWASIKELDRAGVIDRGNSGENYAEIRLLLPPLIVLQKLGPRAKVRKGLVDVLMQTYGESLDTGVAVKLGELAWKVDMDEGRLRRVLRSLAADNIIDYSPPFRGRAITVTQRGLDLGKLPVDYKRIDKHREWAMKQLDLMMRYAQQPGCRKEFILDYFGEPSHFNGYCGACDNCLKRGDTRPGLPDADETVIIQKVLSAAARMQGRFGKGMIAQTLGRGKSEKLKSAGLHRLKTYGALSEFTIKQISIFIEELIAAGCLKMSGGEYPKVELSETGRQVMLGKLEVPVNLNISRPVAKKEAKTQSDPVSQGPVDRGLRERLRKLRLELANHRNVPPYVIFWDRTLDDLCRAQPRSSQELAQVFGMSDKKIAQFGEALVSEIRAYLEESPSP